ncbi:hypothetical protein [Wolbachia endosymbiont (group B) of Athalia cordata]|uniref:hypothetical protein n=1 Tax=Wolbachia endosymbiont (group B) of Athalia cordata TaxID=2953986 RepID=UPI00222FA29F|nr:hypothetical protein [Wolbachia endosymbiont (group B) of Athalia cordata]
MLGNLQRGIVATNSGRWGDNIFKAPEKSQSSEYSSQASDIKSTLENIGDSFYTLADSVSVL